MGYIDEECYRELMRGLVDGSVPLLEVDNPRMLDNYNMRVETAVFDALSMLQEGKNVSKQHLMDQLRSTEATLVRLQERIAAMARYPEEDPCVDGGALYFTKKYPGTGTLYSYVALRVQGLYHLSGARQADRTYDWEQLVEFMGEGTTELYKLELGESLFPSSNAQTPSSVPQGH
jgi:hypothetical protein